MKALPAILSLLVFLAAPPGASAQERAFEPPAGVEIAPEHERMLAERIEELFPSRATADLPEVTSGDRAAAAAADLGYIPAKLLTGIVYTLGSFTHLCAARVSDSGRILRDGWTGDWLVLGEHIAGAEPLDLVGPDRHFPGHSPRARETFVRNWYLLHSSELYRSVPEGSEVEGPPGPEEPDAPDRPRG